MNRGLLISAALLLPLSGVASAELSESMRHTERGELYFGGQASSIDVKGTKSDATAIGATLGINLLKADYGVISADTFFARTIDSAQGDDDARIDVNLAGVFLAYRMPTKYYAKVMAGGLFTELERKGSDLDDDTSDFAAGIGFGAEIYYGVDLELDFTTVEDELDVVTVKLILGD